jgi:protein TonB
MLMDNKLVLYVLRYTLAVIASLLISYALFYFMQSMTLHDELDGSLVSLSPAQHIEFIRVKRKEIVEVKGRKAPKQPEIQAFPSVAHQSAQMEVSAPSSIALPPMDIPRFGGANIPTGVINIPLNVVMVNEEAMPVFRFPPIYPQRAAKRGIEGWVEVEFTITSAGLVKNAHVVAASPRGIFDNAALRAISRWKFKPKVIDKVAVERYRVRQRISFELENGK